MELYTNKDIELLKDNIDNIVKKIEDKKDVILEPSKEEQIEVAKIVLNFAKRNNRKVYGGTAQNALIVIKNPADAFYDESVIPDIDFYSPDPIVDGKKLANELYDKGYKYIDFTEALHKDTYKIFVNFKDSADISYVPKNVYHRIPFIEIDGVKYVHPSFTTIDVFRMFTEPYFSADHRWVKTLPRLQLLQKYYPINKATSSLPNIKPLVEKKEIQKLLDVVYNFITDNENTIIFGDYAYNYFLEESGIMKQNNLGKKYKFLDINRYDIVSTNYQEDGKKLIDLIKSADKEKSKHIKIIEHYPFWNLIGYSFYINYKDQPIVHFVHYNYRCTPIKQVPPKILKDNKFIKGTGKFIQLGSYDYNLLINMVMAFRMRVIRDNKWYQFYNIKTSHLVEMRNYYLKKTGKNLLDNTLFQQFIAECIGNTIDPGREQRLMRDKKSKAKKGPIVYHYYPAETYEKNPSTEYRFPNSSGNEIHNKQNLRIVDTVQAKPRTTDRKKY